MLHTAPNKLPIFTAGDLTLKALRSFEIACKTYFTIQKIPEEEQLKNIAWGMQDLQIQNWYMANQDYVDALLFEEYIEELKIILANWKSNIRSWVLSAQQETWIFWIWAVEGQRTNAMLANVNSYLPEGVLCNQFEAGRNPTLIAAC